MPEIMRAITELRDRAEAANAEVTRGDLDR
jgi:hypothetical protein